VPDADEIVNNLGETGHVCGDPSRDKVVNSQVK
jgi:hypothetical protein